MTHRKVLIQRALSLRQGASYPNFPLDRPTSLSWDRIQTPTKHKSCIRNTRFGTLPFVRCVSPHAQWRTNFTGKGCWRSPPTGT